MAGIAIGVAVLIMLLVTTATVLLRCHYGAKLPQQKCHCSTMELHQMVNEVYTNSIYVPNTDHIRQAWPSA